MNAPVNSACILKMTSDIKFPVGVIDVGSNSVRLMISTEKTKNKFLITTRLAEGKANNRLAKSSVLRTANAVALFFDKAIKDGCESVFIFATASVRNSLNGNELVEEVKRLTGVEVDVVSGELEAELALIGALNGVDGGVIDIGGASTEIAYKQNGEKIYGVSYPIGAVSLKNELGRDKALIINRLQNTLKGAKLRFMGDFYAVGGTCSTLSAIDLKLDGYDACKIHGHYLSKESVKSLSEELFSLSVEEIKSLYPIASARADVIAGGAQILYEVMACYNIAGVIVSESDNLEGYLEYLKNEKTNR